MGQFHRNTGVGWRCIGEIALTDTMCCYVKGPFCEVRYTCTSDEDNGNWWFHLPEQWVVWVGLSGTREDFTELPYPAQGNKAEDHMTKIHGPDVSLAQIGEGSL